MKEWGRSSGRLGRSACIFAIAEQLTRDRIPCPSAQDPARNPHRCGIAWSKAPSESSSPTPATPAGKCGTSSAPTKYCSTSTTSPSATPPSCAEHHQQVDHLEGDQPQNADRRRHLRRGARSCCTAAAARAPASTRHTAPGTRTCSAVWFTAPSATARRKASTTTAPLLPLPLPRRIRPDQPGHPSEQRLPPRGRGHRTSGHVAGHSIHTGRLRL